MDIDRIGDGIALDFEHPIEGVSFVIIPVVNIDRRLLVEKELRKGIENIEDTIATMWTLIVILKSTEKQQPFGDISFLIAMRHLRPTVTT